MGTSRSGTGPGAGVPLVPPWVPDPDIPPNDKPDPQNPEAPNVPKQPVAPPGRFGPARTSIGRFAREGGSDNLNRGLGHYIHKGLGGSRNATRRFEGTTRTASALFLALSHPRAVEVTPGSVIDLSALSGHPAEEIMDAVVEVVRPTDGTQDTEAARRSVYEALSELLDRSPETNILGMSENDCFFVLERYVALDIYNRFSLDIGKTVIERAPNLTVALQRLKDIKDYIRETVSERFRKLRKQSTKQVGKSAIGSLVRQVLQETFNVFEGYVR